MGKHDMRYWRAEADKLVNYASGKDVVARHKSLLQELPYDAMPSRPRGDAKERTFNLLIRDGIDPRGSAPEAKLIGPAENGSVPGFMQAQAIPEKHRQVFGEILADHYVIEVSGGVRFLFPFQSILPGAFEFWGRYKMFNGKILAFLCQPTADSSEFNRILIDRFYAIFNGDSGLTLLDNTVLDIARSKVADGQDTATATAETLINRHYKNEAAPGALMPAAHIRFQRDLESVLAMKSLNRRDLVGYVVNVFDVHLALYFQRLAWLLDEEFRRSLEAMIDSTVPLDGARACFHSDWHSSPFGASIRFRVATGQPTPVSNNDGCARAYADQNRRQLLLPANLSVLGAARQVMTALDQDAKYWSFAAMAAACRARPELSAAFNEALAHMALEAVCERPPSDVSDIQRQIDAGSPGIEVFREALLKTNRSALRRHGRDIVHALAHRGGRGYIAKRGVNVFFFEVGQDLLLLLTKLIVGETKMPFRKFLEELRCYGFAPQDRDEEDRLSETMRVLNLLQKHSDAGEAMYVQHFL